VNSPSVISYPIASSLPAFMTQIKPHIFLIEDDETVRAYIFRMARSFGHDISCYSTAEEFLDSWQEERVPGIAIVDIRLPGMHGTDLQDQLVEMEAPVLLIFVTGYGDILTSVETIKRGAVDFLEKPIKRESLEKAIREAEIKLNNMIDQLTTRRSCKELYQKLTPREREVFELAAKGLLNKQIAVRLGIAEKTVKIHRGRVMHKLQLSSIAQLVQFYLQLNPESLFATDNEAAGKVSS